MSELEINNEVEPVDTDDSLLDEEGDLKDNIYSEMVIKLLEDRNNMK